jgi:hypothetical protein
MTSKVSRGKGGSGFLSGLREVARLAVVVGAGGSAGFTLRVGHRNSSRILLALFVVWVLSPFVALVLADPISKRWPILTRTTLHSVSLILTLASLAIYGVAALGPPIAKPASVFLMVPLASWLLIAIALPISALISRRPSRR